MIIRFFIKLLVIFFPWLALFFCDNPGGALVALVMQVTLIGWPFAANWALRSVNEYYFKPETTEDEETEDEEKEK